MDGAQRVVSIPYSLGPNPCSLLLQRVALEVQGLAGYGVA
jgi:hypothetical protein